MKGKCNRSGSRFGAVTMPRMHLARLVLGLAYVVGATCEISGIKLTVAAYLKDRGDGLAEWVKPTPWQRRRGPGLIVLGIIIGLAGNLTAMYPMSW